MSGYIIVISFLFLAVNAGVIGPWKPWKQDVWMNQIPIQEQSQKFELIEPDLSCDLIIKKDGYVIDDVATGYGGDAVYLKCDARCKGPGATPALAWYKEPSRIPIPPTRIRVTSYSRSSNRVQKLIIRFFLQKDVGFYTCRGWLGPTIGWTEKSIKLQMGCRHPMISCDGSRCLPSKYRCDGRRQCDDGFDEYRCGAEICDEFEFFCDGKCRLHSVRCDGVYDCYDGTDELDCQKSTTTEKMITWYDYDGDNETEVITSAPESTTTTMEVPEPPTTSYPDCDGDLFMCDDGNCIPSSWYCDGLADCSAGEDEWGCWDVTTASTATTTEQPTTTIFHSDCDGDQFLCHDGRCIPLSWRCDDVADCASGEDEWGCWGDETTEPTTSAFAGECPEHVTKSGHYFDVFDNTCYMFVDEEKYWDEAENYCTAMGGEMLRLMNIETMEYVKNKLNSYELGWTNNGVWNGATDMDRGDWEWATGHPLTFSFWVEGEPSDVLGGNCALMRRSDGWRWKSYPCHTFMLHYNFICQFESDTNPTTVESTAFPTTEQSTVYPTTERSTAFSTTEQSTAYPTTEQSTAYSTTEQSTAHPTTEQSTANPTTEQSTASPTTQRTTAETTEKAKVPEAPRITHVSQIQSRSFVVHWESRVEEQEDLRNYQLKWLHNNRYTGQKTVTENLANQMAVNITGLEPYIQYAVSVRVETDGGLSEYSTPNPVITDVAGPSAPTITNVTAVSSTSLYVQWEKPETWYNNIDNYIIRYRTKSGETSEEKQVGGEVHDLLLKDLPTNKEYFLVIAGSTRSLYSPHQYVGNFSEEVEINLEECPGRFPCGDGKCYSEKERCDNFPHCSNERDERDCNGNRVCQESQTLCDDGKKCFNHNQLCDGTTDCDDGSDERNCDLPAPAAMRKMTTKKPRSRPLYKPKLTPRPTTKRRYVFH